MKVMFLPAVSILLPVLASALCPKKAYWELFNVLDTDGDERVSWPEVDKLYHAADLDNDLKIDLAELTAAVLVIAPTFVVYVKDIFKFIDIDQDGLLTPYDVRKDFDIIDVNDDNFKDKAEFTRYVKIYCRERENSCPPQTYTCTFCGIECGKGNA